MTSPDDFLQELLQTFNAEAAEHLQTLNLALLALEVRPEAPRRRELLDEAFRAAHSLKGAARAVSLDTIEQVANAMESVLAQAKQAQEHMAADAYDVLYDALDAVGQLVAGQTVAIEPLISRLAQVSGAETESPATAAHDPAVEALPVADAQPIGEASAAAANGTRADDPTVVKAAASSEETIRVAIAKLDNLMAQVGELLVTRMNTEQRAVEVRSIRNQLKDSPKFWHEIKALLPQVDGDTGERLTELLSRYQERMQATLQDIDRIDQHLRQDTLRLGEIATQLQDSVRYVRMVPFESLAPVLQRAVRDAARSEGKQVAFTLSGGDIELDKKVLEALKDPLLHMLRNAVSHGIEAPAERTKQGKPVEGSVTVALQQRGAEVHITVQDDGAGFDLKGLRRAGSRTAGEWLDDHASVEDVIELAFISGVTTAPQVTAISGRGVGLDVVRQQLEALQGRIHVDTVPGEGSSILLVVPVTLAVMRGLLVQVGDERYVLPLLSVEKIIEARQSFSVQGQLMITVDGATLPLVALAGLLERPFTLERGAAMLVVVMAVAEQRLALVVDDVLTEQELAIKPLGKPLRHVRNVAGAAILGDGNPVLILNTADLLRAAKGAGKRLAVQYDEAAQPQRNAHILVVDDSITTRSLEKNILEMAGYEVTTATDGVEALRLLNEKRVDLVVSDIQMPNMDGIVFTRHLRGNQAFKDLPLILVTSLESREDRERGLIAGANAYIVKRGFRPS